MVPLATSEPPCLAKFVMSMVPVKVPLLLGMVPVTGIFVNGPAAGAVGPDMVRADAVLSGPSPKTVRKTASKVNVVILCFTVVLLSHLHGEPCETISYAGR